MNQPESVTDTPFEKLRSEPVSALNLTVEEYRHRVTGARHFHLAAEDDNNVFLVAFLTAISEAIPHPPRRELVTEDGWVGG